jgi:hypothetical protein
VKYSTQDLTPLPEFYPKCFHSIIGDLLKVEPVKRLNLSEALKQLELCCLRKRKVSSVSDMQDDLRRVKQERDLAKAKLSVVAAERDGAVREMRHMAEQCQRVAGEFDAMAQHCDLLMRENKRYQRERDSALAASESAYEASHMLQEQLSMVTRDRDLAQSKCEELQSLNKRASMKEPIMECGRCKGFYLESENTSSACLWHPGKHIFNRWSCCYKTEASTPGCKTESHIPKL